MVLSNFTAGQGLLPPGEEGTDSPAVVDDIDGEPFIDDDGFRIYWPSEPELDAGGREKSPTAMASTTSCAAAWTRAWA